MYRRANNIIYLHINCTYWRELLAKYIEYVERDGLLWRTAAASARRRYIVEEVIDLDGIIFGFYCRTRETHAVAAATVGRVSDLEP